MHHLRRLLLTVFLPALLLTSGCAPQRSAHAGTVNRTPAGVCCLAGTPADCYYMDVYPQLTGLFVRLSTQEARSALPARQTPLPVICIGTDGTQYLAPSVLIVRLHPPLHAAAVLAAGLQRLDPPLQTDGLLPLPEHGAVWLKLPADKAAPPDAVLSALRPDGAASV